MTDRDTNDLEATPQCCDRDTQGILNWDHLSGPALSPVSLTRTFTRPFFRNFWGKEFFLRQHIPPGRGRGGSSSDSGSGFIWTVPVLSLSSPWPGFRLGNRGPRVDWPLSLAVKAHFCPGQLRVSSQHLESTQMQILTLAVDLLHALQLKARRCTAHRKFTHRTWLWLRRCKRA